MRRACSRRCVAMCSIAARNASALAPGAGRDHQRQHQRRATPGFPRSGTTGRTDRDARRAAPARRRSRRASSRRRPRRCRRPGTSRWRCCPTARSARRGRRGHARECRRPAPWRCASVEVEVFLHPGRGLGERLPRRGGVRRAPRSSRRRRRTRRESRGRQRVGDSDDHRGAGHVHRLVAVLGDGLGRLHHVGHADHPVVGQRLEQARVHHMGEVAEDRQAGVEIGAAGASIAAIIAACRSRAAPGSWPPQGRDRVRAAAANSSVILPLRSRS